MHHEAPRNHWQQKVSLSSLMQAYATPATAPQCPQGMSSVAETEWIYDRRARLFRFCGCCRYRMLDTALLYGNQVEVGEALRASKVPRKEVFVGIADCHAFSCRRIGLKQDATSHRACCTRRRPQTWTRMLMCVRCAYSGCQITSKVGFFPAGSDKLWMYNANNVKGGEAASIDLCLRQLGLEQVDLLLLHNPATNVAEYTAASLPHFFELFNHSGHKLAIKGPVALSDGSTLRDTIIDAKLAQVASRSDPAAARAARGASWACLEKAQQQGKTKFIGVSNYPAALLREMTEYATVMPAVNQLELHPRFASPDLQVLATELGVVLTGYGTGNSVAIGDNSTIRDLAASKGVPAIQVVLRWMLQKGIVSIPRSGDALHIRENLEVFGLELSAAEMATLDALDESHPYYWDPRANVATLSPLDDDAGAEAGSRKRKAQ